MTGDRSADLAVELTGEEGHFLACADAGAPVRLTVAPDWPGGHLVLLGRGDGPLDRAAVALSATPPVRPLTLIPATYGARLALGALAGPPQQVALTIAAELRAVLAVPAPTIRPAAPMQLLAAPAIPTPAPPPPALGLADKALVELLVTETEAGLDGLSWSLRADLGARTRLAERAARFLAAIADAQGSASAGVAGPLLMLIAKP